MRAQKNHDVEVTTWKNRFLSVACIPVSLFALMASIAYGATTGYKYDANGNLTATMDLASDPANCGGLGIACAAGSVCCAGQCSDLTSDVNSCGMCANTCPSGTGYASRSCACSIGPPVIQPAVEPAVVGVIIDLLLAQ